MSFLRPALTWLLIWLLAFAAPAQAVQSMLLLDAALTARAEKTGLIRDQVVDHNGDYGETLTEQGTVYNPFRWNGEQQDPESGLYYLRNRYYQPSTGRFMQRDPISYAGGLNLYGFCGSDPINSSDPDGLRDLTYDMKRKTGSFNPRYDHASAGRGIGFVTTYAAFTAGGGARAINLLVKGGQALRYGTAGLTVFASQHGEEIAEMVEEAILPAGHPSFKARTWQEAGIDPGSAARIQSAATKTGQKIRVFGSRASGKATATSDWDYVLYGANAKIRDKAKRLLPRGADGGELTESGRGSGADFLKPDNYKVGSDYVDFEP